MTLITLADLEAQKSTTDTQENRPDLTHEQRQYWIRMGNKVRALILAVKENRDLLELMTCNNCAGMTSEEKEACEHYKIQ